MKNLRLVLPALAFVFAIVATFPSSASTYVDDVAMGLTSELLCASDILDGGRTIGTSTGQCYTQNDGNGVCTVTFPSESATTAYSPMYCISSHTLYIQD